MTLSFKAGVKVGAMTPQRFDVYAAALAWAKETGIGVHVSSSLEGEHNAGTLHPWGLADDVNVDSYDAHDRASLHGWLARYLPEGFDVVLEVDHVHVEWDVKRLPKPAIDPAPVARK